MNRLPKCFNIFFNVLICILMSSSVETQFYAHGASSYSISLHVEDGYINSSKLSSMNAVDIDLLTWSQNNYVWEPLSFMIHNPVYQGTWDAGSGVTPDSEPEAGDFYFVSQIGSTTLDDVNSWNIGDWAFYDGSSWRKIENSLVVTSVFGRTGDVVIEFDDYSWNQVDMSAASIRDMSDVYITGTPIDKEVLNWSDINQRWEVAPSLINPGAIGDSELASGSIDSSKILDGAITDLHISTLATIDYSKLNIPDGSLSITQTFGLQTVLDEKLLPTGGTFTGDLNMGSNDIENVGSVDGYDLAVMQASVAANTIALTLIETSDVAETPGGGLYYTDDRVRTAVVENAINNGENYKAPSQASVQAAIDVKLDVLTSSTDLFVNSIISSGVNGINLGNAGAGATQTGEFRFDELDVNGNDYVGFKAPDSITSSVTFTLPATAGAYGEMLTTDGSGTLIWAPIGSGGGALMNISATSPVYSSGGFTPDISIAVASSASGGYLTSADWITFNNKQTPYPALATIAALATDSGNFIVADGLTWTKEASPVAKVTIGLGNVENTALSTWPGTSNLIELGTITTGVWQGATMGVDYMPEGGDWNLSADLNIDSNTLVIANDGNVGVGVATPMAKLDIGGTLKIDSVDQQFQADTGIDNANALRLQSTGTNTAGALTLMPDGTSSESMFYLYNSSNELSASVVQTSVNGNLFQISSTTWGGGTAITKSQISASVGIGTTNLNEKLTVEDSVSFGEVAIPTDSTNYGKLYVGTDNKLYYKDDGGNISDLYAFPDNMGDHIADQNINLATFQLINSPGTSGIYVDANGNVGIGSTNPVAPLDVSGALSLGLSSSVLTGPDVLFDAQGLIAAESNLYLNIESNGGGTGDLYIGKGASTSLATNLVTIKNNGNVGIGTDSPNEKLTVNGLIALAELDSTPAVDAGYGKLFVMADTKKLFHLNDAGFVDDLTLVPDNLGDHTATINLNLASSKLVGTPGGDGITINADGNVGIGETAPTAKLHIGGDFIIDDGTSTTTISGKDGLEIYRSGSGNGMTVDLEAVTGDASPYYFKVSNADPSSAPKIEAVGGDADISLNIDAKGTGEVFIGSNSTGNTGIGTTDANGKLAINGALSLAETNTPAGGDTNYGKIYVKSAIPGSTFYFMSQNGNEIGIKDRLIATFWEQQTSGTNAEVLGSNPGTRLLNQKSGDWSQIGIALNDTNGEMTIPAGRYYIQWTAPGYDCGTTVSYLASSGGIYSFGTAEYSKSGQDYSSVISVGNAKITLPVSTTIYIRQYFSAANADRAGLGQGITTYPNVYTQVTIEKL